MQLFLILALLLFGGKTDVRGLIDEVKPVLEELGADDKSAKEMADMVNAVEEISALLGAAGGLGGNARGDGGAESRGREEDGAEEDCANGFPLAPVSKIADKNITYALSRYFSEEA